MKILFPLIIIAIISSSLFASSVNDKRIRFKKGENSTIVSGNISSDKSVTYILSARSNQKMKVTINPGVIFNIKDLKTGLYLEHATEIDEAQNWEGVLPSSGDYRITLSCETKKADYKMTITIW